MCGALPYLHPECWQLLAASSPLCVCPPPSPKKCFSRSPSCPRRRGAGPPPALTLTLTPTHRTHIWAHFQVDFLLVVVPQLLGGLGLLGDVGFLGVLDEVRVVFPLPGGEGGSVTDVASKRGAPLSPPPLSKGDPPRQGWHGAGSMPGWPQKEQEGFGTDLSPSFWGVPATSIPSRPWGCTPGAAGGGRGAPGPPWAAAARLQGGGLGGARWWPQHLAGLISGSLFPASPFPPCLQITAPWGGFLMGGTRRGGARCFLLT